MPAFPVLNPMFRRLSAALALMAAVVALMAACTLVPAGQVTPTPERLSAGFIAPLGGAAFAEGTEVVFQLVARDEAGTAGGIARIELFIDSLSVGSVAPQNGVSVPVFTATMNWRAAGPGLHAAAVIAYGADGTVSEPASLVFSVTAAFPAGA